MNKREFLAAAGAAAALPALPARAAAGVPGPVLLTVSGAIGAGNRGPLDPALDQMMKKQGVKFERAHAFDFAALRRLPAQTIRPTLEYDGRPHALRGPLLAEVLKAAGAKAPQRAVLRAIDGYAPVVGAAELESLRFIVATELDGRPMSLGGLGPLWAVHDADRIAQLAAKPLAERFALCPWGLYHIEVM
ncbi:MAG TPA: molybdopterin-dependent oxidoreductase [Noviherbaspirillum sp.]|uniref:molybdopterin-dependent oxidoreductase n=1 Tax=Noviherbaspirillum sp. TaxID=1926288 RepID=UPI002F946898